MDQHQLFEAGVEVLSSALCSSGFEFTGAQPFEYPSLVGRGIWVVRGAFARAERRLEFEVYASLRNVIYRIGALWLPHEPYMRALGVPKAANAYPGFSDDPIEAFRHLKLDLERFGSEFLTGDAAVFRSAAAKAAERRPVEERRKMASWVGDDRNRSRARELFRAGKYPEVVVLLEAVQYPEFMDDYERRILEVAKRKTGQA